LNADKISPFKDSSSLNATITAAGSAAANTLTPYLSTTPSFTNSGINVYGGTGTVGSFLFDGSGNWTTTSGLISSGNVGVGTATAATTLTVGGPMSLSAPSTINSSTYTVTTSDSSLIFTTTNNTLTLPSASSYAGRILYVKNITANSVTSASSNVVPISSASAGTAILAATAGKFAMLQSDGTNWIVLSSN
jgi:hypothetical protein